MTEPNAPEGTTSTFSPQPANGQLPPASQPKPGSVHTRLSGVRTSLIAGTARITQLRRIIRRDRRAPRAS